MRTHPSPRELGDRKGHDSVAVPGCYANALHPDRMTADERLDEVADILAAGFLRLRTRESANNSSDFRDFPLDFPGHQSVPGRDPRQSGE